MSAGYYCFQCRSYFGSFPSENIFCPRCGQGFIQEVGNTNSNFPFGPTVEALDDNRPDMPSPEPTPLEMLLNRFTQRLQQEQGSANAGVSGRSSDSRSQHAPPIGFSIQLVPIMATPNEQEVVASPNSVPQSSPAIPTHSTLRVGSDNTGSRPVELVFRIDRDGNNRPHLNVNVSPYLLRAVLENQAGTQQALNRSVNDLIALFGGLMAGSDGTPPVTTDDLERIPVAPVTQQMIEDGKACSICLDLFILNDPFKEMPCHHQYHVNCIERWLLIHGNCPICRTSLSELISPLHDITEPD
ncbi:E3 ubiquitin-protein ligase RNF126-like [Paramacrobiotus metropolitanus]|uniref:E3 ubiquitin-protein ligase RNF126-like n=1 Tax=Paramacrobiotus metropolitanus TaxID=2943436 RepID=UPI002445FF80|nr:E3 ubiquitin-protein ligase RNF126-like [Paramacrobiotus metropolitanus]